MNRDETAELFLKGREAWNAWAQACLPNARRWRRRAHGNRAAPGWSARKAKTRKRKLGWTAFADFSRCLILVRGVEGTKETAGEIDKEGDGGPPVKSIQLEADRIDFEGFLFPSDASFDSATFTGGAWFASATFTGDASFASATFTGDAQFDSATFTGGARFESATFTGDAWFASATFTGDARFASATFTGDARFASATFTGYASFESATFTGGARFESATFTGNAFFPETLFKRRAAFSLASFKQYAKFASAHFEAEASFYAIRGERGFDMAGAEFEAVPDFIQAHFEEAPRLDNLKVLGRWVARHPWPERKAPKEQAEKKEQEEEPDSKWRQRRYAARHFGGRVRTWPVRAVKGGWRRVWEGNSNIPAQWRALKRLAIQGHDTERELEYHARELKSLRFEDDWPLPFKFWRAMAWVGVLPLLVRYVFMGLFSVFSRSLSGRPCFGSPPWRCSRCIFCPGSLDAMERRRAAEPQGFGGLWWLM